MGSGLTDNRKAGIMMMSSKNQSGRGDVSMSRYDPVTPAPVEVYAEWGMYRHGLSGRGREGTVEKTGGKWRVKNIFYDWRS